MLIFAIDDEPKMLKLLHKAIAEAAPEAEIMDFSLGTNAVSAVEKDGFAPDVVFSDISMPGLDGLGLAVRLKRTAPDAKIVFVTGYSEYAVRAYSLHVQGYVMKPVESERVREELQQLYPQTPECSDKLRVHCFGYFEVFHNSQPVMFGRKKTKELLAFLIDREGAVCTAEEIASALWEKDTNMTAAKTRLRQLIRDLKTTFSAIGMSDIIIRRSGQLAIRRDMIDCDYYRMLDGDMDAVNSFRGEYMEQYSWAELTNGRLYFRTDDEQS